MYPLLCCNILWIAYYKETSSRYFATIAAWTARVYINTMNTIVNVFVKHLPSWFFLTHRNHRSVASPASEITKTKPAMCKQYGIAISGRWFQFWRPVGNSICALISAQQFYQGIAFCGILCEIEQLLRQCVALTTCVVCIRHNVNWNRFVTIMWCPTCSATHL